MIVLDTNVVSEAMKPSPDPFVRSWLNDQAADKLYLSSVTLAELFFGIGLLPAGSRKNRLADTLTRLMTLFNSRIRSFDIAAASHYGKLSVRTRLAGQGLPVADGYIAAIAAAQKFSVASRDTAPFIAAGIEVINPWQAQQY